MSEVPQLWWTIVFQLLPWVMYGVFTIGILLQVSKWLSGAKGREETRFPLGGSPRIMAEFVSLLLFQSSLLRWRWRSIILWLTSWTMHITLFLILLGHLRSIGVWSASWFTWLAPEEFLVSTAPLAAGILLLLTLLLLTLRRLLDPQTRIISLPSDYLILLLILLLVAVGDIMRVLPHSPEPLTITFPPGIVMHLEKTPALGWLTLHTLTAEVLIMYLPFSKLIHMLGVLATAAAYSIRRGRLRVEV